MSKTASRLALSGAVLVVIVAITAFVVLGRLGRLIESGVETHGPGLTGTEVALGGASVSIFSGEGELTNLRIGNPEGYSDDRAFDLGRIKVAIDPKSVVSDVIHIRQVVVDGPRLLAEFDANGRNNLKTILNHVKAAAGGASSSKSSSSSSGGGKRMIIDEFRFENAEARALAPAFKLDKTLKLPPVVLKNLGAKQGGAAAADIVNQVMRPIVDATVTAATREYVKAQRDKLGGEAKDKAKEELNKLFGK
jgi:uncharacterized protein involved in outer membrane biogenesis